MKTRKVNRAVIVQILLCLVFVAVLFLASKKTTHDKTKMYDRSEKVDSKGTKQRAVRN